MGVLSIIAEPEFTEEEYNRLKRKIDWTLLPLVCDCQQQGVARANAQ